MNQHEREKFESIFSHYLDGEISPEELTKLEEAILQDPEVTELFSQWCLTHRQVIDVMSEDRLHGLIDKYLVGGPGPPEAFMTKGLAQRTTHSRWAMPRFGALSAGRIGAITAMAVAVVLLWNGLFLDTIPLESKGTGAADPVSFASARSISPRRAAFAAATDPDKQVVEQECKTVASLTQLYDAKWADAETPLQLGQLLEAGTHVTLQSGRAKITFDCGAEIVLEGPCDFELESRMAGMLYAGKITADVPRRAFGFGILCPNVDLVDLGTSFGVNVGPSGATELHVFQGEVLCNPTQLEDPRKGSVIHVRENEAMEFAKGDIGSNDITLNKSQFESLRSIRRALDDAPPLMATEQLALWLAADKAAFTDEQGRVVNWPDILHGDNVSAEDALQSDPEARPLLVRNAINGLPVIRFDGKSDYLLTTPLQTTDDQTVIFICQFSPVPQGKERLWGGQIINYDGPPSRYLSDTLEPGVLQIGEPLLESQFQPTLITSQVFAGFVGETTIEAGRVDAQPVGGGVPTLVAYTYNYSAGRSELRINGRLAGEARAFAPQKVTSRKIIGRHSWMDLHFHGDLAELLIYNRALSDKQLTETSTYLAQKYALQIVGDLGEQPVEDSASNTLLDAIKVQADR